MVGVVVVMLVFDNQWLPDGVGTNACFTGVPQVPYILPYVLFSLSAHIFRRELKGGLTKGGSALLCCSPDQS